MAGFFARLGRMFNRMGAAPKAGTGAGAPAGIALQADFSATDTTEAWVFW